MGEHPDNTSDYEGAARAYATHAEGQRLAREEKHKESVQAQEEARDKGLVSVDGPLTEEAKFVANPDDLRKEVDSEEKFSEGLKDNPVDVEVGSVTVTDPGDADKPASVEKPKKTAAAKKTAAKKTAAKK